MIDLNHQSGLVYGRAAHAGIDTTARINAHVDAALVTRNQRQRPRDYLGGSRVGEACARKLVYEVAHAPKDAGRDFDGGILRIFDAGHQFETLSIRWLRQAGFDLRDRGADGEQFGFAAAGGKLRGHADGVIVAGPDVGIRWPALFEHKALGQKSWNDLVKHGLRQSKPVYHPRGQDRPGVAHRVQPGKKGGYTRQRSLAFCRKTRQLRASLPPVEGSSFAFPEMSDDLHDLLQRHLVRRHRDGPHQSDRMRVRQHRKQRKQVFDLWTLKEAAQVQHRNASGLQAFGDVTQAAYLGPWLWKMTVEKAGSFDVDKIAAASAGIEFDKAPEGYVKVHPNHHLWSKLRIGQWQTDGQARVLYGSELIEPDPFPKGYQ